MILRTLFHPDQQQTSAQSASIDDGVVPAHSPSLRKPEPDNPSLSISEAMMREKLKILLAKK